MSSLDHAGLAGIDPQGAVTFVENHDTDRGGVGGPIVRNKMLAYAYTLTSEGYPAVFYRDYSKEPNCFGLRDLIDPLIQIHEHVAQGPTEQRWKDGGVFAFERMGGGHLLVGLNKDAGTSRTITVQTGFPANTPLQEFTGHGATVTTQNNSQVTIVIPKNTNGEGYVCYGRPARLQAFLPELRMTTQEYEGAQDLDIKPAVENERVQVCRVFCEAHTDLRVGLSFDASQWTPDTSIQLEIDTPQGSKLLSKSFRQADSHGSFAGGKIASKGFYAIFVKSTNTPAGNKAPAYKLAVSYSAPQVL
jgi:alpha-amylase